MKRNFLLKSERGGMLVELMMSVAIASILIPFIFRYQQNAVERARNISITKQMETVQTALERYIIKNRMDFLNIAGTGPQQFTVSLDALRGYGLSDNFIDDYIVDYQLRVLKYGNNADKPVLQGVVLLNNTNNTMSTLRTHEIANLGGGKIGYIKDENVYGGFNVFKGTKTSFGLGENDKSGILGTTRTMRGNSLYLWRLGSDGTDGRDDATMLSLLNLAGHNIANAGNIWASKATFSDLLNVTNKISTERLVFTARPSVSGQYSTSSARVYGDVSASGGTMNITNNLVVNDSANFNSFTVHNLQVKGNVNLTDATIPEERVGTKIFSVGEDVDVNSIVGAGSVISEASGIGALTPFLWVKKIIYPRGDSSVKPEEELSGVTDKDKEKEKEENDKEKLTDEIGVVGKRKSTSPRSATGTDPDKTEGQIITGIDKTNQNQDPDVNKDQEINKDPENNDDPETNKDSEINKDPENNDPIITPAAGRIDVEKICGKGHKFCWNAEYKTSSGRMTHMAIFNELILLNMNRLLYKYHCGCVGTDCTYGEYVLPAYDGNVANYYPLFSEQSSFGKVFAGCKGLKGYVTVNEALDALEFMKSKVLGKYVQYYNDNRD